MVQPGNPDKPPAYWFELPGYMALAGLNPTLAGALLAPLKNHVKAFQAALYRDWDAEVADEIWALMRDHIYGWPPPGA